MSAAKNRSDRLRAAGERDYLAGKPIDAFYDLTGFGNLRPNFDRGAYEIGWRCARDEKRRTDRETESHE
jgi:hypothetical protein